MPPLSDTQHLFLELLRSAIWDRKPQSTLFESVSPETWGDILTIARQQSLQALIADRILVLPEAQLPPYDTLATLLTQIRRNEARNLKLNKTIVDIHKEYSVLNIPFVLLKGQANALCYPNPLLRSSGDIDLFLYNEGDYDKANQWVKEQGYIYHVDDRDGHRAYEIGDVVIENHKFITFFEKKKYNTTLQGLLKDIVAQNNFEEIRINGLAVRILPPEMNGFYIFLHFFFHFIHGGVGYRQFCDWVLFLYAHHGQIDDDRFEALAKSFDVLYPMQLFAQAAIKYLNAPESIFPISLIPESRYSGMIVEEIFKGGNFGFHHTPYQKNYKTWTRRWLIFRNTVSKTIRFGAMAPQYLWIIPGVSLFNRAKKALTPNK